MEPVYYAEALDLVAEELNTMPLERFEEKRLKLAAIVIHASKTLRSAAGMFCEAHQPPHDSCPCCEAICADDERKSAEADLDAALKSIGLDVFEDGPIPQPDGTVDRFGCHWNIAPFTGCGAQAPTKVEALRDCLKAAQAMMDHLRERADRLENVEAELARWKICENCGQPLEGPGICDQAITEHEKGLLLMLDETLYRAEVAEAAEACLSRLKTQTLALVEAMWQFWREHPSGQLTRQKSAREMVGEFAYQLATIVKESEAYNEDRRLGPNCKES